MLRHGLRVSVAILTFTISVALVWTLALVPRLEAALADRFVAVNETDLRDVSPVLADSTQDANEIYHLLIRERYTFRDTALIVVASTAMGYSMVEDDALRSEFGSTKTFHQLIKEWLPEVDSQTLDNYLERNKTRQPLLLSNLRQNYVIVDETKLHEDDAMGFWMSFYKKYPRSSGLISFSNVGFNSQHSQAFVYAARSCGGLCGEGMYVLLKKVNGRWEIQAEQGLWVS